MHELGVVFYVIRDVKKVAEENQVKKINSVTLEIGEVSGVVHDYLIDCWNWARKKEPLFTEAELRIEELKAVTYCEDCKQEYGTVEHGKTCPYCGSEHTYLLRGNEFLIKEIEITDPDEVNPTEETWEAEIPDSEDTIASGAASEEDGGIEKVLESGMYVEQ